jgi:hypothetical protein
MDDVVTVLEDLNDCLNGIADASQVLRSASIKRVTKGSYKAGFMAPASLVMQVNNTPAAWKALAPSTSKKSKAQPTNVSQVILKMLQNSGLHRDSDLKKRLTVSDSAELERLAGVSSQRAQSRCLRDGRGKHVGNVHLNQKWMFDVLTPSSIAEKANLQRPTQCPVQKTFEISK